MLFTKSFNFLGYYCFFYSRKDWAEKYTIYLYLSYSQNCKFVLLRGSQKSVFFIKFAYFLFRHRFLHLSVVYVLFKIEDLDQMLFTKSRLASLAIIVFFTLEKTELKNILCIYICYIRRIASSFFLWRSQEVW